MIFAVIGGDGRSAYLRPLLLHGGHEVREYALQRADEISGSYRAASVIEAASGADCVILPLPLTGDGGALNALLDDRSIPLEEVWAGIRPGTLVCAGLVSERDLDSARGFGHELIDYYQREELTVSNAVATTEGALSLVMSETPATLWRSRALVIGFGRIGKLLAHRLRGLCAEVSVSARSHADFAWINAYGYKALDTRSLSGELGDFDIVLNTVPALILNETLLCELKPGVLCVDLASKPGGIDFSAASAAGVRAIWALGLPGETAPLSSAGFILDAVYNILDEKQSSTKKGAENLET